MANCGSCGLAPGLCTCVPGIKTQELEEKIADLRTQLKEAQERGAQAGRKCIKLVDDICRRYRAMQIVNADCRASAEAAERAAEAQEEAPE